MPPFGGPACGPGWRGIALSDSRAVAQEPRPTVTLGNLAAEAGRRAVEEVGAGLVAPGDIWITIIDCRDPRDPRMGSLRGDAPVYPASVVKLCYMTAAFDQNRLGLLPLDHAMRGDLKRMIGVSDNKATNRILDRLANTSFGPELEGPAWDSFAHKRQIVERYFQSLGLGGLKVTNKTFDETIPLEGRDMQWLGPARGDHFERSNSMTTDDTARLLYLIWRRAVVDRPACEEMLHLMRRTGKSRTFFSSIVPPGTTLYSKSGWTGLEYHDAGIFDLGEGRAVIVVAFSLMGKSAAMKDQPKVIQRAGQIVLERLLAGPGELDNAPPPAATDAKKPG